MSRNPYEGDERSYFIGIDRLCCSQKALRAFWRESGAAAVNVFYYANKKYTQAD